MEHREGIDGHFFTCILCEHKEFIECVPQMEWDKNTVTTGYYRFFCSQCGAFMYPSFFKEGKTLNDIEDFNLFYLFAACPNACDCFSYGSYSPSCEHPRIKPECLFSLHEEIAFLVARLEIIEKRLPPPSKIKPEKKVGD